MPCMEYCSHILGGGGGSPATSLLDRVESKIVGMTDREGDPGGMLKFAHCVFLIVWTMTN